MSRNWKPKSKVSVTDAGMVIEIEVGEVSWKDVMMGFDDGELCPWERSGAWQASKSDWRNNAG